MFKKRLLAALLCAMVTIVPFSAVLTAAGAEAEAVDVSGAKPGPITDGTLSIADDGKSFTFRYGGNQYGEAYVYFPVTLPEGKTLADYSGITYTLQTLMFDDTGTAVPVTYGGKHEAVLAMPRGEMPDNIDWLYGDCCATNVINLFDSFMGWDTDEPRTYTRNFILDNTVLLNSNELDISIYIHMENASGTAGYTISDISLIPADAAHEPAVFELNEGEITYNANPRRRVVEIAGDGTLTINLPRALKTEETLVVETLDSSGSVIEAIENGPAEKAIYEIKTDLSKAKEINVGVVDAGGNIIGNSLTVSATYEGDLSALIDNAKRYHPDDYTNGELLADYISSAVEALDDEASTNTEYVKAMEQIHKMFTFLQPVQPFGELPPAATYQASAGVPDVLTMLDGTKVTTKEQWAERDEEIRNILQYYAYGIYRKGKPQDPDSDENLSYTTVRDDISITVTRDGRDKDTDTFTAGKAEFTATVTLPKGDAPDGGWPAIIGLGGVGQAEYVLEQGYATIVFSPNDVASDDDNHTGAFYNIYPYLNTWSQQTGALMGWAWGVSKIVDALESGADKDFNINTKELMVNGVSRYGKGAAVASAFDERIKVGIPTCSGYPGMTTLRYKSDGQTYYYGTWFDADYPKASSINNAELYTFTGGTEPMSSHASNGWMNQVYREFRDYEYLPFDQHFLASLSAKGRDGAFDGYLYMVIGIASDNWSSPPGMYYTFEQTLPVYELLGIGDRLAVNIHPDLHGNEQEDMEKLFALFDYVEHGKEVDESKLSNYIQGTLSRTGLTLLESLHSTVYALDANKGVYDSGKPGYTGGAVSPDVPDTAPQTPDVPDSDETSAPPADNSADTENGGVSPAVIAAVVILTVAAVCVVAFVVLRRRKT